MAEMTDIMVDIETTGTSPGFSGILQIAAVKFNLETGDVDPVVFDRCPVMLPNRFWSDSTRDFWNKFPRILEGLLMRQEDAYQVFQDFGLFASGHSAPLRFWSKPLSFDWPMIASHYEQLGLMMPFHYRTARDLNTYIACCSDRGADHIDMKHIEDAHQGPLHNALSDCVLQIKMAFEARNRGRVVRPIEDAVYEDVV